MIIIARKYGQLCNRLLLFANFIAFAEENNVTVANIAFDEYAPYFKMTSQDLLCRYPKASHPLKYYSKIHKFIFVRLKTAIRLLVQSDLNEKRYENILFNDISDFENNVPLSNAKFKARTVFLLKNLLQCLLSITLKNRVRIVTLGNEESTDISSKEFSMQIKGKSVVLVQGWLFLNQKNLIKHADIVRRALSPLEEYENKATEIMREARKSCKVLIGVHIRQKDYATFMDGRYFYSIKQYTNLMAEVSQLFPENEVGFIIFSDTVQVVSDFNVFNVFFGSGHLIEDLISLSLCDYIIGPPSTYSTWASFYGSVPLYHIEDIEATPTMHLFKLDSLLPPACHI